MAKKIKDAQGNVYVQKKPFYQRWWFIALIVLIIFGYFGQSNSRTTTNSNSSKSSEASVKTSSKYRMGQVVTVGDVEYIINSTSTATNIGGEYGRDANGVFLILNVTVKNNGKEAITISDNFFTLLKGETEYTTDSAAGMYANENGKFLYSELNPESSLTGNVIFDITEETANSANLQVRVQTGVFGTETEVISLQ